MVNSRFFHSLAPKDRHLPAVRAVQRAVALKYMKIPVGNVSPKFTADYPTLSAGEIPSIYIWTASDTSQLKAMSRIPPRVP